MNLADLVIVIIFTALLFAAKKAYKCFKKDGVNIRISKMDAIVLISVHGKLVELIDSGKVDTPIADKISKATGIFRHQTISQISDTDFTDLNEKL